MSPNLFCPGCGHDLPAGVAFCPACGNAVPAKAPHPPAHEQETIRDFGQPYRWMETPPAPPRPVVPQPTAPPPPVYQPPAYQPPTVQQNHFPCPGCGQTVVRGASFCPQCGRNQQTPYAAAQSFQPQPAAFAQTNAATGFSQRSASEQLLMIVLAIIAASIILAFFC